MTTTQNTDCDVALTENVRDPQHIAGHIDDHVDVVFDPDTRQLVGNTIEFPWNAIGQLRMKFPNGKFYTGTGTLIGDRHVLTAAHNVYGKSIGGNAESVEFFPGRNGTEFPYGIVGVSRFFYPSEYAEIEIESPLEAVVPSDDLSNYQFDYAVLKLAKPVTNPTVGVLAATDEELTTHQARISGYPGDKPKGTMWTATGLVAPAEHDLLSYKIDTYKGQSGSSVMMRIDDIRGQCSVGVHVAGSLEWDANIAVRMTKERIAKVRAWMETD